MCQLDSEQDRNRSLSKVNKHLQVSMNPFNVTGAEETEHGPVRPATTSHLVRTLHSMQGAKYLR